MNSNKRRRNSIKNKVFSGLTGKKVLVPAHAIPGGRYSDNTLLHGRVKVGAQIGKGAQIGDVSSTVLARPPHKCG
eukprot:scaffold68392_cov20-Tisochrysis_lutea.AAC.1